MLFSKYWFLPGSGVLLKKKDSIVRSLANTVEAHIINPELIEDKIRQVLKELDLDKERTAKAFNMVIDEVRQPLLSYATSEEMKKRFIGALEREGGVLGEIANYFGIIEYEKVADIFRNRLAERIQEFAIDTSMVKAVVDRQAGKPAPRRDAVPAWLQLITPSELSAWPNGTAVPGGDGIDLWSQKDICSLTPATTASSTFRSAPGLRMYWTEGVTLSHGAIWAL